MLLTILIALATSPYIQAYDYPILSIPYAFLVTRPLKVVHFLLIGLTLAAPLQGPYLPKNYWIIISLALMLLINVPRKRKEIDVICQAKSGS
jgi:hypothetical protein